MQNKDPCKRYEISIYTEFAMNPECLICICVNTLKSRNQIQYGIN